MTDRTLLPGHLHPAVSTAAPLDSSGALRVTLVLHPRTALGTGQGAPLSREAFAERHGADAAAIGALRTFAEDHGLEAVADGPGGARLRLSGPAEAIGRALHVRWGQVDGHRVALDEPSLPGPLAPLVKGILGLDARPKVRPHLQAMDQVQGGVSFPGYTPMEVAALYGFPEGDGAGQCVGVIELGGGFDPADMATYFGALGLPVPEIVVVSLDGQANDPLNAPLPERQEVSLDLQVLGAVVPKAKLVVYFAPNTGEGMMDAIDAALHDTVNKPSVVSLSWGGAESTWSPLEAELVSDSMQAAVSLGVTLLVSSGDYGSADQQTDGKAHVNFPASSPWALACGGTTLVAKDGTILSERAWNNAPELGATGGGVSEAFELPDWQKGAGTPPSANDGGIRRALPDLAGNADMATGYRMVVGGQWQLGGGTSAVAPLMAGLVARMNAALGKPCGYLQPLLYGHPEVRAAIREITEGDNGAYRAGRGYNACTGLGVPRGAELLRALKD